MRGLAGYWGISKLCKSYTPWYIHTQATLQTQWNISADQATSRPKDRIPSEDLLDLRSAALLVVGKDEVLQGRRLVADYNLASDFAAATCKRMPARSLARDGG